MKKTISEFTKKFGWEPTVSQIVAASRRVRSNGKKKPKKVSKYSDEILTRTNELRKAGVPWIKLAKKIQREFGTKTNWRGLQLAYLKWIKKSGKLELNSSVQKVEIVIRFDIGSDLLNLIRFFK